MRLAAGLCPDPLSAPPDQPQSGDEVLLLRAREEGKGKGRGLPPLYLTSGYGPGSDVTARPRTPNPITARTPLLQQSIESIGPYLLPDAPTAANLQQRVCCYCGRVGQEIGAYRFITHVIGNVQGGGLRAGFQPNARIARCLLILTLRNLHCVRCFPSLCLAESLPLRKCETVRASSNAIFDRQSTAASNLARRAAAQHQFVFIF